MTAAAANARDAINRPDLPPQLADQVRGALISLGNQLADGQPIPAMNGELHQHLHALAAEPASSPAYHNALAQIQGAAPSVETMPRQIDHAAQNATLHTLRSSNVPGTQQAGDHLTKVFHDREMSLLAQDVGVSADINCLSNGQLNIVNGKITPPAAKDRLPPAGWSRLSEQPQKMAEFAKRMGIPTDELQELLRPDKSGFRAEIYLPDEKVLGPGYKPTVLFKGSAGTVSTADGKSHDTAKEDFLANNFPQAIGMKTDYYDRAMTLGSLMKKARIDFEVAGHSLGGGLARSQRRARHRLQPRQPAPGNRPALCS